MSFILDALKKVEQKRQRGSVPDLMTIHMTESRKPQGRQILIYLFFAALILNAGILALWLHPWETEKEKTLKEDIFARQDKQNLKISAGDMASSVSPMKEIDAISNNEEKQTRHKSLEAQSALPSLNRDQRVSTVDVKLNKTSADKPLNPSEEDKLTQPQGIQGIPELSQLSQTVQSEIPKLNILGHIYSTDPVTRIVNINGNILREGDAVAKDIKIEEITEEGVIFNYNGLFFRIKAF